MQEKEWFETWFNTPYYHLLYNHRDEKEAQRFIDALLNFLGLEKNKQILDVACGKGRHAYYMAKKGYLTFGFDISSNSIKAANQIALDNLQFAVWDMRKPFAQNKFDLVTNLFSSFGYFDDEKEDEICLKAMSAALVENGILVLDYMNPEFILKNLKPKEIINKEEIQFHISKKTEHGFIKKRIQFLANGEEHDYEEKLKIIKPETFQKLFASANLEIQHWFGDYELNPFNQSKSPRQIIIARKKSPVTE